MANDLRNPLGGAGLFNLINLGQTVIKESSGSCQAVSSQIQLPEKLQIVINLQDLSVIACFFFFFFKLKARKPVGTSMEPANINTSLN